METRFVNAPSAPAPASRYAQAVELTGASRFVFVSGQVPVSVGGETPELFVDQARLVWSNVAAQLEAADMTIRNIVKHTTFLSDRRYIAQNRQVRAEALGDHAPALTLIVTGVFDEGWLLEIEAIAAA